MIKWVSIKRKENQKEGKKEEEGRKEGRGIKGMNQGWLKINATVHVQKDQRKGNVT